MLRRCLSNFSPEERETPSPCTGLLLGFLQVRSTSRGSTIPVGWLPKTQHLLFAMGMCLEASGLEMLKGRMFPRAEEGR